MRKCASKCWGAKVISCDQEDTHVLQIFPDPVSFHPMTYLDSSFAYHIQNHQIWLSGSVFIVKVAVFICTTWITLRLWPWYIVAGLMNDLCCWCEDVCSKIAVAEFPVTSRIGSIS